jgi:biotin carboxyl carrier protein
MQEMIVTAPRAGVVKELQVSEGASLDGNDLICKIEKGA